MFNRLTVIAYSFFDIYPVDGKYCQSVICFSKLTKKISNKLAKIDFYYLHSREDMVY